MVTSRVRAKALPTMKACTPTCQSALKGIEADEAGLLEGGQEPVRG